MKTSELLQKKEKAILEKGNDGLYSVFMPNDDYNFGLSGYGTTEQEAIDDFYASVEEMRELEEADGRVFPNLCFEIQHAGEDYNIKSQPSSNMVAEDEPHYGE